MLALILSLHRITEHKEEKGSKSKVRLASR